MTAQTATVFVIVGYAVLVLAFVARMAKPDLVSIEKLDGKLWTDVRDAIKNARR